MVDIEKTGMYRDYKYIIFLNDEFGYRSAYVEIPEDHRLYGVPYQDLDIEVKDVIVDFSGFGIRGLSIAYCIGWHHNHSWDDVDENAIRKAHPDKADELINKARDLHGSCVAGYKSLDQVEYECQCVIDWIIRGDMYA